MKRIIHILLLLCVTQGAVAEQDHTPIRNVKITDDGVIVTYEFNGGIHQQDIFFSNAKSWNIPTFGLNDVVGEPAYPFKWDTFVVPDGATVSIEVLDSAYSDTMFVLSPACPPIVESDTTSYIVNSIMPISPYTGFYPQNITTIDGSHYYREQALARVGVMPLQYDMENHIVRAYSKIQYKLTFVRMEKDALTKAPTSHANVSNHFIENIALNSSIDKKGKKRRIASQGNQNSVEDNRDYLIITVNSYLDAVNKFADWKRTKGNNVIVESRVSGNWTVSDVKSVIRQHYAQNAIQYVLIVGDNDDVPGQSYTASLDGTDKIGVTDLYYGMITDNDAIPSIFRGRISVGSNTQAKNVFNKIIQYEKEPVDDEAFYQTGAICTYFEDEEKNGRHRDGIENVCFTLTSELIRNHLVSAGVGKNVYRNYYAKTAVTPMRWNDDIYSYGDSIPSYLRRGNFAWDGNADSIIAQIDRGTFFVLHRGHGDEIRWQQPVFWDSDVTSLSNGNKLPVVFSINCLTGAYNMNYYNCFAEKFLKKQNGGCVAIYAATMESYSGHNDAMALGMFDAIWPGLSTNGLMQKYNDALTPLSPTFELGQILDQGLYRMSETFGAGSAGQIGKKHTYKIFHCFGDPSMMIYTEKPTNFTDVSVTARNDSLIVSTNVSDVRITIYNPSTEAVHSYIGNYVKQPLSNADSLTICVDKHNYVPYICKYYKAQYIQNETICDNRLYTGQTIKVGNCVTTTIGEGPVLIQNANVKMKAGTVELQPGTTIINSNVKINTSE